MIPKKSFGQNFLTSLPAREAIVAAGRLTERDTVLEIGPGKGFLTESLLRTGAKVVAVEKDEGLQDFLQEKFKGELTNSQLTLLVEDILFYEPPFSSYKIIANIPYYITGAILERFLSHERKPLQMVVLVQREVAERVVARDGKESILSLSVKAYGLPKIVHRVSAGSFFPKPKVDSSVLSIESISGARFESDEHELTFFMMIKQGFLHKRKKVLSNLKEKFAEEYLVSLFKHLEIPENTRAENVTLETWITLSLALSRL